MGVLRERGEIQDDVWTFFLNLQSKKAAGAHTEVGALNLKPEPSGKKGNGTEKTTYYIQFIISICSYPFFCRTQLTTKVFEN